MPAQGWLAGASQGECDDSSTSSEPDQCQRDDHEKPTVAVLRLQTTADHVKEHAYPTHIKDCERCRWWHNRDKWAEDATFPHPQTGLPVVWLVEQPKPLEKPWHLGCIVCMHAKAPGLFGRCKAGAKLSNIRRHAKSASHIAAVASYVNYISSTQTDEVAPTGLTFAHIMFQRTLLKRGGSFESFQDYCKTARLAGAAIGFGSVGPQISRQLTSCMAARELHVTRPMWQPIGFG